MNELITYLSGFITPGRLQRFEQVLDFRTHYISVVLENIYQAQNASAVVRTCDCFGIQDIHIIENENDFKLDREVALGAEKWLSIHRYRESENNTLAAINSLRNLGYRIIATSPHKKYATPEDFDLSGGKAAVFFGTELTGISDIVRKQADDFLRIPMFGFTQSYNISVSVALVLQTLVYRLQSSAIDWKLTTDERMKLKLQWLRKSIRDIDFIERQFLDSKK